MLIPLGDLLNISSGFGPNNNFVFLAFFFSIVPLYLIFVVVSKIKLIPFYCSYFGWLEIWHADVSWPPFLILAAFWLSETGQICYFRAFSWDHKGGMASNLACWCILTTVGSDDFGHGMLIFLILAPFWLSETVQIWGFLDFLQIAWEEWPKIWHGDVSLPPLELITFGSWSIGFPHFGAIWLSETCQMCSF